MGIALHRVDLALMNELVMEGGSELAPEERLRARRFALSADRARYTQTRIALRRLLARRLACDPAEVPLGTGLHGKPCVLGEAGEQPHFNVSHSGAYALIAVADPNRVAHVGVDIEVLHHDIDAQALLDIAFTDPERRAVLAAPDVRRAFYARWVGKEAVLKAMGVGVAEHLHSVTLHSDGERGLAVACSLPGWQGIEAMALPAPPGYAAALAWQTKEAMCTPPTL
jgi:4'-phosphopantetheinyl transferase